MSLGERISEDLMAALKAGEKEKLSLLRIVKSAIKNKEIEKGSALDDSEVEGILRTFVKRAGEAIEQYEQAGRIELAEKESMERTIAQSYLPAELDEDGIRSIIREVIVETGAAGQKDMGRVMKAVMVKAKGQVNGKKANSLVKEMLEA